MQAARIATGAMERICAGATSVECMAAIFEEYAERVCFGYCEPDSSEFTTLTYAQVWGRVKVRVVLLTSVHACMCVLW